MGVVHQRQVEVCVHPAAEMHMAAAPVGVQRRLDITVFTDLGEHFPQQGGAPFLLVRARGVVIILLLQTVHLFGHDGLIPRQIKPAFLHTPARFL